MEVNELMERDDVKLYVDRLTAGALKVRSYPELIRWAMKQLANEKQGKFGAEILLKMNQVLSHDQPQLIQNVNVVGGGGELEKIGRIIAEATRRVEEERGPRG